MASFFIIVISCLSLLAPATAFGGFLRVTENDCSNSDTKAICADCYTLGICIGGTENDTPCSTGEACQEMEDEDGSIFAQCVPVADIPGCNCPSGTLVRIPDVYDNQKYILCLSGQGTIQSCGSDYFDPTTEQCTSTVPTDAPTTPDPSTCTYAGVDGNIDVVTESCVAFRVCFQNNTLSDTFLCPENTIFNENTLSCDAFETFSCSDFPTYIGLLGDPNNCTVYHYCVTGDEQLTGTCPTGENFDNSTMQCDSSASCDVVTGCSCSDDSTIIPYNCTNYYECVEVSEGFYEPVFQSCPSGFYFNEETMRCDQSVPGCP